MPGEPVRPMVLVQVASQYLKIVSYWLSFVSFALPVPECFLIFLFTHLLFSEYTSDDFELQFQVNYLGHHLIVLHLLPLIQQSGPNSRVVFTSTGAFSYKTATKVDFDDMQGKKNYPGGLKMMNNSKLYQVCSLSVLPGVFFFSWVMGEGNQNFIREKG